VTSFSARIEKSKESLAYCLGAVARREGSPMVNPFDTASRAALDWIDGYLDAAFLEEL